MTECQDCHAPVRFVLLGLKEDGSNKWSSPLDLEKREVKERKTKGAEPFVHQGYVLTEYFTIHQCPQRQQRLDKERHARQERQARARTTDEAWVEALKRHCPRCEEPPESRCINLTHVRLGRPAQSTRRPHAERLPFGWYDQHRGEVDAP